MMEIKIIVDAGAIPRRAHEDDAGLDLYSQENKILWPWSSYKFQTGVHVQLPPNTAGFVKSRSSMMDKNILTDGTVDVGYTGPIGIRLFNLGWKPHKIRKGDKIAQLVIPVIVLGDTHVVDSFEETERGDKGFGSSGR